MWASCPLVLNEPVKVFGLEMPEFMAVIMLPLTLRHVMPVLWTFGVVAVLAVVMVKARRGRPYGALPHLAHAWEVIVVPGVLRPSPVLYSPWVPEQPPRGWQRLLGWLS